MRSYFSVSIKPLTNCRCSTRMTTTGGNIARIAVAIVISLQTVGVALMMAMLVTPAATAFLLTRRLPTMMALAALIGAVSGVAGLYLSFYISVASGAAIVLVCTFLFVIALLFAPRRGWLWRRWSR